MQSELILFEQLLLNLDSKPLAFFLFLRSLCCGQLSLVSFRKPSYCFLWYYFRMKEFVLLLTQLLQTLPFIIVLVLETILLLRSQLSFLYSRALSNLRPTPFSFLHLDHLLTHDFLLSLLLKPKLLRNYSLLSSLTNGLLCTTLLLCFGMKFHTLSL